MIEKLSLSTAAPVWQSIQTTPLVFFTYEWHKVWFETEGKEYEPYILLVNNTILASLARKEDHVIFSAQRLSDYSDIFGPEEEKAGAWEEILEHLKQHGVKTVQFRNISQDSASVPFFQSHSSRFILNQSTTPILHLPSSFDEYLALLPKRSEVKRKLKRFEEENPSISIIKSSTIQTDFPTFMSLVNDNPAKRAYITPPIESFFNALTTIPDTQLVFLLVNHQTVAGRLYFEDEHTIYGYNSGYLGGKYSGSGFYLLLQLIKQAITNKKTAYNFLRGSEGYKYELGAKDFAIFEVKGEL